MRFKYLLIIAIFTLLAVSSGGFFFFSKKNVFDAKKNAEEEVPAPFPQSFSQESIHKEQGIGSEKNQKPPKETIAPISAITGEILKGCLAKTSHDINPCLDRIFHPYLQTHSTKDALALVESAGDNDPGLRVSCHPVVHSIGRETFLRQKTIHDSFAACDQTCHSGCYHGAIERFLRGSDSENGEDAHISEEEIIMRTRNACSTSDATRFRFQCLHGLGHALMFFLGYKLEKALAVCETLGDSWTKSSCYGGAFMENVFSATPEKRDLSKTDYHYPCSKLDAKYKSDCYMMQTTRMSEMGFDVDGLFRECRKAGAYTNICFQSIGRDLSNDVRIKDPALTSKKCADGTGEEQNACVRGVIYALMDNTWTGKYAFPFCASFQNPQLKSYCFSASAGYLKTTYQKSNEDIAKECATYLTHTDECRAPLSSF